jgi:hypothetical protein
VNIGIGAGGQPLSANNSQNSAIDVGFKLQPATKGMTTNSTKGIAKSTLNGNVSVSGKGPGGRKGLPTTYKRIKGA